eukprot:2055718-Rhodomonas_salina.1
MLAPFPSRIAPPSPSPHLSPLLTSILCLWMPSALLSPLPPLRMLSSLLPLLKTPRVPLAALHPPSPSPPLISPPLPL